MDIFIMQYNYRYRYLVVKTDAKLYVRKYEKNKFDRPFFSFLAIFFGKSNVCNLTEFSAAGDKIDFDGTNFLLD